MTTATLDQLLIEATEAMNALTIAVVQRSDLTQATLAMKAAQDALDRLNSVIALEASAKASKDAAALSASAASGSAASAADSKNSANSSAQSSALSASSAGQSAATATQKASDASTSAAAAAVKAAEALASASNALSASAAANASATVATDKASVAQAAAVSAASSATTASTSKADAAASAAAAAASQVASKTSETNSAASALAANSSAQSASGSAASAAASDASASASKNAAASSATSAGSSAGAALASKNDSAASALAASNSAAAANASQSAAAASASSADASATTATNKAAAASSSAIGAENSATSAAASATTATAKAGEVVSSAQAAATSAAAADASKTAAAAAAAQAASSAQAATAGGVRYDTAQSLTADQKTQAKANIGLTEILGAVGGIATLDSTGKVPAAQLPSFVDDVVDVTNFAALPAAGELGKIYLLATPYTANGITSSQFRWSGTVYAPIIASPGSTDSVTEGAINQYFTPARARAAVIDITGNAGTASKLATPRTIAATGDINYTITFDGSGNVTAAATLASNDLKAIAGLTGATGILRKTAAGVWSLDTSAYLTGITSSLVTTALGFTPYSAANPSGFITSAGNAATATALSSNQTNWSGTGVIGNVVGMIAWRNYGNGHVVFDASNSVSPSGAAVNNINAAAAWSATYPTLMGWNGSTTYGVRVDSARVSDNTSGNAATAGGLAVNSSGTNNQPNQLVRTDANGYTNFGWINTVSGDNGRAAISRIYASGDAYLRYYTPANFLTALNSSSYARESNGGVLNAGTRYSIYTGGSAINMSLPTSGSQGDEIEISNLLQTWATNAFTITCPSNCRINSALDNLVCNHNAGGFTMVLSYFDGSTYFWTVRT